MLKKLREKLREKKGFTLLEMILTVSIVAVLTGLVSVGIHGYLVSAYMNRVNETAKTVFLAAQNYLTQEKQLGKLADFNDAAEPFGGEIKKDQLKEIFLANDPSFDFGKYEAKYGTTEVRYILLSEGEGKTPSDNPIYKIINQYLGDNTLLDHTFLIEYDAGSGVIRSVFYTEKASTFTYSGDRNDKQNAVLRGSDVLKEKRQGYYGVSSTSLLKHNLDLLSPAKVKLVNGERLYLEWKETNYLSDKDIADGFTHNATEAFDDTSLRDYIVYDVEVYRTTSGADEKLFTLENINAAKSGGSTLAKADKSVSGNKMVLAHDSYTNTYQLLLDDLHHGIADMYSKAMESTDLTVEKDITAADMIYCKVSVRLAENKKFEGESEPVSSNLQSVNYAGGAKTYSPTGLPADMMDVYGNGNLSENGLTEDTASAFSVANARHLNNLRNASNSSCYVQTANIDWAKPESDRTEAAGLFTPVKFAKYMGAAEEAGIYYGKFRVEKNSGTYYKISNLSIDCLTPSTEKNVGMFRQNKGTITGLSLLNPTVKGASQVGCVVGVNAGTISNVTVDNGSVEGSFYVGGIAGKNLAEGMLTEIQCDAAVKGNVDKAVTDKIPLPAGEAVTYGQNIGGIAGYNQGSADKLTTTILDAKGEAVRTERTVSGVSSVGGIFGGNETGITRSVTSCTNYNSLKILTAAAATADIKDFGGIVGRNEKDSRITSAINKSLVFLEKDNANPKRIKNIGGIAGTNDGLLKQCTNSPKEQKNIDDYVKTFLNAVGTKVLPVYSGVNVGGIAGTNGKTGELNACMAHTVTLGYRVVGGLVGENHGSLKENQTLVNGLIQTTGGFVAASADSAGGIAGLSIEAPIEGCVSRAIVFASSAAGGISGANGAGGNYNFSTSSSSDGYYDALLASGYETTDKNAKIVRCENYGFVYALNRYSGGITGINFGIIDNSNSDVTISAGSTLAGKFNQSNYKNVGSADCVGGIAGCNSGSIIGGNLQLKPVTAELYGKDGVGGIVGLNNGAIKEYARVLGNVYAAGNSAGGVIGMNINGETVENLALSDGMRVNGEYFAGGIIGLNISSGNAQVKISNISTQADARRGSVTAKAYAGGIIGYQTKLKGSLSDLVQSELKTLITNVFAPYQPSTGGGAAANTEFSNCINRSEVNAQRYVGGIIGYNSNDSGLLITKATNYGKVAIVGSKDSVKDGFYFIGGITGRNSAGGTIDQCINDGSVISPSKYLGGICEVNEGYVQYCISGKSKNYNDDGIKGDNSVGGLVGLNSNHVVSCSTSSYAKISGGDNTGGLVGTNDENGVITGDKDNVSICAGSVVGKDNTGGIVGKNEGRVENVSVKDATISGSNYVGGFIGSNTGLLATSDNPNNKNVISGLTNNAKKVTGNDQVGGIVGKHNATTIENCVNQGSVEATGTTGYAGGITGSVAEKVTILTCTNYGTVVSKKSQAGGIAGNNEGTVRECRNYGSVEGSLSADDKSAIGGIVGVNETKGEITDCISASNKEDPDKSKNPNADTKNALRGVYIVGGLTGMNKGTVNNKTQGNNVSIDITLQEFKINNGNIGGVFGVTKSSQKLIKGYTYSGTITVPKNASANQFVGGIIGQVPKDVTLENCIFAGTITGYGNADGSSGNGIGGLAGYADGTIIVEKNIDGIFTSNTDKSSVSGCVNIGGVTGLIGNNYQLLLKDGGTQTWPADLAQNKDSDESNDTYYVNLASVSGGRQAGGFYGKITKPSGAVISFLQNGQESNPKAANIMPDPAKGKPESEGKDAIAISIGGITGSVWNSSGSGNKEFLELNHLRNYGTIGSSKTYITNSKYIGGLVGVSENGGRVRLKEAANHGEIICGRDTLGGIVGKMMGTNSGTSYIEDCYNYGKINVKAFYVGGITGYLENSVITVSKGADRVLNKKGADIVISGNSQNNGGIAGIVVGSSRIEGVENAADISNIRDGNGDSNIGGICGRLQNETSVINCTNSGDVTVERGYTAGGIAGWINGAKIEVSGCHNKGQIKNVLQDGGGIAGKIEYTTGGFVFKDNVNEESGIVSGKYRIGGVIGYANTSGGATWDISNCTNKAQIRGILPAGNGNTSITRIGGLIGSCTTNAQITNFVNTGDIVVDRKDTLDKNLRISEVSEVGGVFGYIADYNDKTSAAECKNSGSYQFDFNGQTTKLTQLGGIAGNVNNRVTLDTCSNIGKIDLTALTASAQQSIGGIMGKGSVNSKLTYCVNQADVLTDTSKGDYVGGIAGITNGLVYSCSTIPLENKTGTVSGHSRIGGIVGYAADANCKISSIVNKAGDNYAFGMNNFTVQGQEAVGGISGYNQGATIYSMANSDAAKILLLSNNTTNNSSMSAGGIVGTSVLDGTVPGIIANCYSFGQVRFSGAGGAYYLGGVVGNRSWNGNAASLAIKDSFYLYEPGTHDLVDISQPDGKIPQAVLAVGNEPEGMYMKDPEDQQFADTNNIGMSSAERFRWSKSAYEKMYRSIKGMEETEPVPNADSWDNLDTVLNNIVKDYNKYKLPIPITGTVTSNDNYSYTLPIEKMPGFCEYLEVNFYPESATDEDIKAETAPSLLKVTKDINMDNQLTNVGFDASNMINYMDYVGQVIKVAVKAHGVGEALKPEGEIVYTADSDNKVVQEFILMPVLVTPQVSVVSQEGSNLTFQITNWVEYQKSAGEFYASIAANPKTKNLEIYTSLLKGLENFTITDYYLTKEVENRNDSMKDTWTINQADIDASGIFTIDYSTSTTFKNQKSNRQWHDWDMQAVAMHKDWSVEASSVMANGQYRYTSSYMGNLRFRIEAVTKMKPPTNLTSVYTGGIDWQNEPATPSYEIQFKKSESPEDAVAGYQITVKNPANGKTHTMLYVPPEVGVDPDIDYTLCAYPLDKNTLLGTGDNQLGVDLSAGSQPVQLEYTISTQPNATDAAKFFAASDDAPGQVTLLKKQYSVKPDMTVTVENANKPNELTFRWEDDHTTGSDVYMISYQVKDKDSNVITAPSVSEQMIRDFKVTLPDDGAFYMVEFTVVRKGVANTTVESLNSDPVTYIQHIGKKLDPVTNVSTVFSKVDDSFIYYTVTFDVPAGDTADNCKGFRLEALSVDALGTPLTTAIDIPFGTPQPLELKIPLNEKGKQFYAYVTALNKGIDYTNSDRAQSTSVTIPSDSLTAPAVTTAKIKKADGSELNLTDFAAGNAMLRDELKTALYNFGWTIGSSMDVKCQQIVITDGTNILYTNNTGSNIETLDVSETSEALAGYAGQNLILKVYNMPIDPSIKLPSAAGELTFQVPKVILSGLAPMADPAQSVVIHNGAAAVTDTDKIPQVDYPGLTYTFSWQEGIYQPEKTATKIMLFTRIPDTTVPEGYRDEPVTDFTVAGTGETVADGIYRIPYVYHAGEYDENGNPKTPERSIILTGIDASYQDAQMVLKVINTGETVNAGIVEPNPVCLDSPSLDIVFKMPVMLPTTRSRLEIIMQGPREDSTEENPAELEKRQPESTEKTPEAGTPETEAGTPDTQTGAAETEAGTGDTQSGAADTQEDTTDTKPEGQTGETASGNEIKSSTVKKNISIKEFGFTLYRLRRYFSSLF